MFKTYREYSAHADRVLDYLRCRGANASILFRIYPAEDESWKIEEDIHR
jgi:hypothetical protein